MKKILFILYCFISLSLFGQVPEFEWAIQLGSDSNDAFPEDGHSIAIDHSGNVYVTGHFQETADFDPGPNIHNLIAESNDIFIAKYNANGQFLWAHSFGDGSGYGITTDTFGNVYVTGEFTGITDFDPGPDTYFLSSNDNGYDNDIFVLKLNTDGSFLWAKNMGGSTFNRGCGIAVDNFGNVYTTGYIYGMVDFDPGPEVYNLNSEGSRDIFISKLNSVGEFVWAKKIGGQSHDSSFSITLDSNNNVYTTGYFDATVDFDPGPDQFYLTALGERDQFISKLSSDGNFVWAKNVGGFLAEAWGRSIAIDESGNVYTTGHYIGMVDFDPGLGIYNLASLSTDLYDIFVLKLDTNGGYLWAKPIGGLGNDLGLAIALDKYRNVYITGRFEGTVDFDPGPGIYNLISIDRDIYVLKLNTNGSMIWVGSFVGNYVSAAQSITIDDWDNIYTTGNFRSEIDFDPGIGIYEIEDLGSSDIFIHKMRKCTPSFTKLEFTTCDSLMIDSTTFILSDQTGCDSIVVVNTTLLLVPEMPTIPGGISIQDNEQPIQITVPEIPNATAYAWIIPPDVQILSGTNTNSIEVDWSGLTTGGTVCVIAINECGSSQAACMEVTIDITDALNDIDRKSYSIFPNPTTGTIFIHLSENTTNSILEIKDYSGRSILKQRLENETELNLSEFSSGAYFLLIQSEESVWMEKLVKF